MSAICSELLLQLLALFFSSFILSFLIVKVVPLLHHLVHQLNLVLDLSRFVLLRSQDFIFEGNTVTLSLLELRHLEFGLDDSSVCHAVDLCDLAHSFLGLLHFIGKDIV